MNSDEVSIIEDAEQKLGNLRKNSVVAANAVDIPSAQVGLIQTEKTAEQIRLETRLSRLFMAMFGFQILLNIVDGVLPASLVSLEDEVQLSYIAEGAMGGLVYAGLTLASLFAGPIFERFSARKIIAFSTFGVGVFVVLFGIAPDVPLLLISRFGIGVTLAFITIYAPVWVDEFAPQQSQTMWMSILQLAIPLGVMLGYGMGILTSKYGGHGYLAGSTSLQIWRAPFVVQGVLILPIALCVLLVDDELCQRHHDASADAIDSPVPRSSPSPPPLRQRSASTSSQVGEFSLGGSASDSTPRLGPQSSPPTLNRRSSILIQGRESNIPRPSIDDRAMLNHVAPQRSLMDQVRVLTRNGVYLWTTLGLSALFFVVTGIQFWVTPYLVIDLGQDVGNVGLAFIFASATGPTCGVLFGGYLVDKFGGYRGRAQAAVALKLCLICVVIAVSCCMLCMFSKTLILVILFIWLTLFSGGAMVPPATGILMSCVPKSMKHFSSSFAQMVYNLLGYCLSPVLSGLAMQLTGSRTWGFRLVMLWSLFGAVAIFFAWRAAVAAAAEATEKRNSVRARASSAARNRTASVTAKTPVSPLNAAGSEFDADMTALDLTVPTTPRAEPQSPLDADESDQQFQEFNNDANAENGHDEEDEDDEFDDSVDIQEVKVGMIFRPAARHSFMADFSSFWSMPALLQAASGERKDQFADTDLIMTDEGQVHTV